MTLGVLTLNVASPSVARAERQLAWLAERKEQVLVLTELSSGAGSHLLIDRFAAAGWEVRGGGLEGLDRGVAIASRLRLAPRAGDILSFLPSRAESVALGHLDVVGVYVPSRDDSLEKVERKRNFCTALSTFLTERAPRAAIVIGDLNILEPTHRPRYGIFHDWEYRFYEDFRMHGFVDAYRLKHPEEVEYSWVDYRDRGYRFDHVFVSEPLAELVQRCAYVHDTRETDLSDHSALLVELDWPGALEVLDVHESLTNDPLSLF
jgi:exodeoxyribonuclease III